MPEAKTGRAGSRVRVLFVVPFIGEVSGWATASLGMIKALINTGGVDAVVAVARKDRDRAARLFGGVEILSLPAVQDAGFSHPRTWWRASCAALEARFGVGDRGGFDLVHSLEVYPAGWLGSLLARGAGALHVVTAIGTYSTKWAVHANILDRHLYRRTLMTADFLCSISQATLDRIRMGLGDALAQVPQRVIFLGTETLPEDTLSSAVADRQQPIFLSVGAVKRRKGQDVSLRAFLRIRQRYPRARYRIVGKIADEGFHRELMSLLPGDGDSGVSFLGAVSDQELSSLYTQASIFILTPQDAGEKFEGFGLVFLEAGRFGLPIVASSAGGVSEAVIDGVTGILTAPGDVDAVVKAAEMLLEDPKCAIRLGAAGRHRARELSWSRFAAEQRQIYAKLGLPSGELPVRSPPAEA